MSVNDLPPINLDESTTHQYVLYDPTTRRTAISETTKYAGTGTFFIADGIPYRDAINTLRQPQTYTPVWLGNADYTAADVTSIILGDRGGGAVTAGSNSVAITPNGGPKNQVNDAVAVGYGAGQTNQGPQCVAIGYTAGQTNQGPDGIAIGTSAGQTDQQGHNIAIGKLSGAISQQWYAIAIGSEGAGYENQGQSAIAIGVDAGRTNQGNNSIAIGYEAGRDRQLPYSIAIGTAAGKYEQQSYCIAIGHLAGHLNQQKHAIAIGHGESYVTYSPGDYQGYGAIAIGSGAGTGDTGSGQDAYSICIGYNAGSRVVDGTTRVPANTILIDASGPLYTQGFVPTVSGTYIRPIRNLVNIDPSFGMYYNPGNFELSWGVEASSARFKTRVINLFDRVIAKTLELNPVEFDFTETGRHSIGFIAEDVYKIIPEIVVRNPLTGTIDGIEYDKLVVPLVKLAQDRQRVLDSLQESWNTLTANYETLQASYKTSQAEYENLRAEYENLRAEYETNRTAVKILLTDTFAE